MGFLVHQAIINVWAIRIHWTLLHVIGNRALFSYHILTHAPSPPVLQRASPSAGCHARNYVVRLPVVPRHGQSRARVRKGGCGHECAEVCECPAGISLVAIRTGDTCNSGSTCASYVSILDSLELYSFPLELLVFPL